MHPEENPITSLRGESSGELFLEIINSVLSKVLVEDSRGDITLYAKKSDSLKGKKLLQVLRLWKQYGIFSGSLLKLLRI